MCLERSAPGMLQEGVTKSVARDMGVPLRVVQRVWRDGKTGGGVSAFDSNKKKNCGAKKLAFNPDVIKDVPLRERHTIRDLATALHMSKSTLHRRLKEGKFRRHTNAIKFTLTEQNMKERVRFCLQMLDILSLPDDIPTFKALYNVIYIDEKWFYRTKKNQIYYLAPGEQIPRRHVKSKNFIEKVMFLCVTARPRFENGVCTFDGKIGIFPFTTLEPAKRKSPNRPRGIISLIYLGCCTYLGYSTNLGCICMV
jgi:hypothetical protein